MDTVKGFKGFDKNLKCRDKQYAVGEEYVENEALLCKKGLHFCKNPHDIFNYYAAGNNNRFCEIEAFEVSGEVEVDSKRVTKRLFVKNEVSAFHICKIAASTFFENFGFRTKIASANTNTAGDLGAANAGDYGAANAGHHGAANAGDYGAANAGDYGAANAGDLGAANAGDLGAANAGHHGAAAVKENGVAIASTGGKVKGDKGSVLVLVNRDNNYNIIDHGMAIVDGTTILPDTWYKLDKGEFVSV
jgi:hypothetical protein